MDQKQETVSYIREGIFTVCKRFKNRSAGSKAELACQHFFEHQLRAWADETRQDPYFLHPEAFYGWVTIASALNLICIVLYWLYALVPSAMLPAAGVILSLLCVSLFIFEFLLYREYIDFLFPSAMSTNVYARRTSNGTAKRRIVFVGHADTACEFTYCLHGKGLVVFIVLFGSILGMFVVLCCSIAALLESLLHAPFAMADGWMAAGILQLCFVPFFIALLFFFDRDTVVDGANDNLSGSFVAMGVLKELFDRNVRFEHTEVCCLITGGEEVGLRGASAFAENYKKPAAQEIETIFVALDTLREEKYLRCYLKGINGTQQNSPAVGRLLHEAAKRNGIDLPEAQLYPGATDAEAFSRSGLMACGLCAVNHDPQPYYHTRYDTYENIDIGCIKKVLEICLDAVHLYDQHGIIFFAQKKERQA